MTISLDHSQVHPSAIASELDRIRRQAADLDSKNNLAHGREIAPRVRATLANLVLLVTEEFPQVSRTDIDHLVRELCISHPSRFFIVNYTGPSVGKNPALLTTVASRCVLAKNGMHVCSEEVTLNVCAERVTVIPNLLLSLFVPDIECVILLLSDISRSSTNSESLVKLFSGLTNISDILICDSGEFKEFSHGLSILDDALRSPAAPGFRGAIQRDMNWISLARWRALIAEQFDAIQMDPDSKKISRVSLSFAHHKTDPKKILPPQILFLAGWISVKLNWAFSHLIARKGDLVELKFVDCYGGDVSIECHKEKKSREHGPNQDPCRSLRSVSIVLGMKDKITELRIERTQDLSSVDLSIKQSAENSTIPNVCNIDFRRVPFTDPTLEQLVPAALAPQAIDQDFLLAREQVLKICQGLPG